MDKVIMYTTGCPKCEFLERALKNKSIDFEIIEGEEAIEAMGYKTTPLLEVNGNIMKFADAVKWVAGR